MRMHEDNLVRPRVLEPTDVVDTPCMRDEASGSGVAMNGALSRSGLVRLNSPARRGSSDRLTVKAFLGSQPLPFVMPLTSPGHVEETT